MSDFGNFVSLAISPSGLWTLTQDMPFDLVHGDISTRIVIPAGFCSDGPTIPALARVLFNPAKPSYMKASIVHDWMLAQKSYPPSVSAGAFRDALKAAGNSPATVFIMWLAVLIWTSIPWR